MGDQRTAATPHDDDACSQCGSTYRNPRHHHPLGHAFVSDAEWLAARLRGALFGAELATQYADAATDPDAKAAAPYLHGRADALRDVVALLPPALRPF